MRSDSCEGLGSTHTRTFVDRSRDAQISSRWLRVLFISIGSASCDDRIQFPSFQVTFSARSGPSHTTSVAGRWQEDTAGDHQQHADREHRIPVSRFTQLPGSCETGTEQYALRRQADVCSFCDTCLGARLGRSTATSFWLRFDARTPASEILCQRIFTYARRRDSHIKWRMLRLLPHGRLIGVRNILRERMRAKTGFTNRYRHGSHRIA